jgi:hypothetical protein
MRLAFIAIFFVGAAYFALKRRRFDFISVAYFSAGVYFLPAFFGFVQYPTSYQVLEPVPLANATYVVMAAVLTSILVGGVTYDALPHRRSYHLALSGSDAAVYWACAVALFGFFATVATTGSALLSPEKNEMLARFNRWAILWEVGASLTAVLAFSRRKWGAFGIALVLLLADVYIGVRVSFALSFIACFVMWSEAKGRTRFAITYARVAMTGLAGAAFFFIYKFLYIPIKTGQWELIISRLGDRAFYLGSITESEPFITQTILNQVLIENFHVGVSHFRAVVYQFMLFAPAVGVKAVSFNDLFQRALFPHAIDWGMANNIWAEMYSSGGVTLLALFIVVNVGVLGLFSKALRIENPEVRAVVALLGSYWAFYLHRNDLFTEVNLLKRVFLIGAVAILTSMLVHDSVHRLRRRLGRRPAATVAERG